MTKPEVKKQFIQNMFERENCEAIAITKSKEILADLANLYDEQTKKYVISRLCELYKDKESLDADQPSTIRDCITKFIIKESEQTIKQEAFKMFSEVLDDNEKNNVYSEILRNDDEIPCADSYKIISMHKEIQENSFFSKDLKQNSIKNLCKLYKNLKNSPEKTIINSFMADVLLKYEENEIHIRDIVTTEFYSLLPESEKKSFLILVSDKCLNDEVAVSELPSSFLDEFFKADIEPKRKETLIKIVINNFLDNEDEELLNRDWVNYVDEQTKATTLKALCDLYESSSNSVKQEKIKNRIEDFIINESDAKIKSDAFANFSKVLKLENKKNIYRTILNKDDAKKPEFGSYKILKMHEEIQDEASYPEDMKITSIENLCQFYGCKALSEQERSSIFTFMLNFIINYQKNELQVREKIFYEFYEKDFLKDKKNDFLKAIFNKSKNEPILLSELPESLKAEIIKSKDILPDEKKQLVESEFNNYLNKKAAGKIENNAVDFIVNFLVDGAIAIDTRKELLRKILEKTNRSNNEF